MPATFGWVVCRRRTSLKQHSARVRSGGIQTMLRLGISQTLRRGTQHAAFVVPGRAKWNATSA
jgi:hypothetical protein